MHLTRALRRDDEHARPRTPGERGWCAIDERDITEEWQAHPVGGPVWHLINRHHDDVPVLEDMPSHGQGSMGMNDVHVQQPADARKERVHAAIVHLLCHDEEPSATRSEQACRRRRSELPVAGV